jgi:DNA-binding MarR family transcriptional regulator
MSEESLPPMSEALEFIRLLREVNHAVESASSRALDRDGLTAHQQTIIRLIGKFPNISPTQLGEILHADPSTISISLARLQRRGIVSRLKDPADKRRLILGLTAKGRALDVPSEGSLEDAVIKALAETTPEQLAATRAVLKNFSKKLSG